VYVGIPIVSNYQKGKEGELKAAEWLSKKFTQNFSPKSLQVGVKIDDTPALHNFDLVSEDGQIVAEVKSHRFTASGNIPSAKISDTYACCGMLEKVAAKQKLLILTDTAFYRLFKRYSDGKIAKSIKIICIDENEQSAEPELKILPPKSGFEVFWAKLAGSTSSRQTIKNWTVNKGFTGEDFEAGHGGVDCLIVYPPSAQNKLRVPKSDFHIMFDNWQSYRKRKISRGELAKLSRFTKYTISILHQYQDLMKQESN
jgi:hypothetical protein